MGEALNPKRSRRSPGSHEDQGVGIALFSFGVSAVQNVGSRHQALRPWSRVGELGLK